MKDIGSESDKVQGSDHIFQTARFSGMNKFTKPLSTATTCPTQPATAISYVSGMILPCCICLLSKAEVVGGRGYCPYSAAYMHRVTLPSPMIST